MIDRFIKDYFEKDSYPKNLKIELDDGTIFTEENIEQENFSLEETLNSDNNLKFGSCEASCLKFRLINTNVSIKNQFINVYVIYKYTKSGFPIADRLQLGRYFVAEENVSNDKSYRDIVSYDYMYVLLNMDVTTWYDSLWTRVDQRYTLKDFRDSFFNYVGIEQIGNDLVNDNMLIARTISASVISGKDIICAICEINGVFGHMTRNNEFKYISLEKLSKGLYPSLTTFPSSITYAGYDSEDKRYDNSEYISFSHDDVYFHKITGVQVHTENDDIGKTVGDTTNVYAVTGNFLCFGYNDAQLTSCATNLFNKIKDITFIPFKNLELVHGNPCYEVGDKICVVETNGNKTISYLLNRTINGFNSMTDKIDCDVSVDVKTDVNSMSLDLVKLRGKTNKILVDVEKILAEIAEISLDGTVMKSTFTQTSSGFLLAVDNDGKVTSINVEDGREGSTFEVNADNINLNGKKINLDADNIEITSNEFTYKNGNAYFRGEIKGGSLFIGTSNNHAYFDSDGIEIKTKSLEIEKNGDATFKGKMEVGTHKTWYEDDLYESSPYKKEYTIRDYGEPYDLGYIAYNYPISRTVYINLLNGEWFDNNTLYWVKRGNLRQAGSTYAMSVDEDGNLQISENFKVSTRGDVTINQEMEYLKSKIVYLEHAYRKVFGLNDVFERFEKLASERVLADYMRLNMCCGTVNVRNYSLHGGPLTEKTVQFPFYFRINLVDRNVNEQEEMTDIPVVTCTIESTIEHMSAVVIISEITSTNFTFHVRNTCQDDIIPNFELVTVNWIATRNAENIWNDVIE